MARGNAGFKKVPLSERKTYLTFFEGWSRQVQKSCLEHLGTFQSMPVYYQGGKTNCVYLLLRDHLFFAGHGKEMYDFLMEKDVHVAARSLLESAYRFPYTQETYNYAKYLKSMLNRIDNQTPTAAVSENIKGI
jgi:hypothetical protein